MSIADDIIETIRYSINWNNLFCWAANRITWLLTFGKVKKSSALTSTPVKIFYNILFFFYGVALGTLIKYLIHPLQQITLRKYLTPLGCTTPSQVLERSTAYPAPQNP